MPPRRRAPRGSPRAAIGALRDGSPCASVFREQALRPNQQDQQKDDVTGEGLPRDVELRADRLCDAEHDSAGQGTPHVSETAEDDHLEGDEKTRGTR